MKRRGKTRQRFDLLSDWEPGLARVNFSVNLEAARHLGCERGHWLPPRLRKLAD